MRIREAKSRVRENRFAKTCIRRMLAVALFMTVVALPQAAVAQWAAATGGSATNDYFDADGVYWRAHIFTDVGDQPLEITAPGMLEYLIVGGGGGGGGRKNDTDSGGGGGGGGAGGVLIGTNTVDAATYTVTVGSAGAGGEASSNPAAATGEDGGDSSVFGLTAIGGGGGGAGGGNANSITAGRAGGSGGGGSSTTSNTSRDGGSGTEGQGFGGGSGSQSSSGSRTAGGGGGAAGAGADGVSETAGVGGPGISTDITGETLEIAGGGGGGAENTNHAADGGFGGGGDGAGHRDGGTGIGEDATSFGSGGGGAGSAYNGTRPLPGGNGSSGIVVVRYRLGAIMRVTDEDEMDVGNGDSRTLLAIVDDEISHTYVVANQESATENLLLTNNVAAVVFEETGNTTYGGFSISQNITTTELEPGQSAPFTLHFTTNAVGQYSATLSILSNDPSSDPRTIELTVVVSAGLQMPVVSTHIGAVVSGSTEATLHGVLTEGAEADEVYFAWDTKAGLPDITSDWQHVVSIGSAIESIPFELDISGLYYGQPYYYMVYAVNSEGSDASLTGPFLTDPPDAMSVSNDDVDPVRDTSAVLHGSLTATNAIFTVTAYWSGTDHGDEAAWMNAVAADTAQALEVGSFTNAVDAEFSIEATDLAPGTQYYYTFMAANAATNIVATPNESFETFLTAADMALYDGDTPMTPGDRVSLGVVGVGGSISNTFTIANLQGTGFADLLLTGDPVVVFDESGSESYNGFTISSNVTGDNATLSPGESATFTIAFGQSTMGAFGATVRIDNNAPGQDPFLFEVQALSGNRVAEISNPYESVNWNTFEVHLGNFHNHTTRSDGHHTVRSLILDYHSRGYSALAITDHNSGSYPAATQVSHPWEQFTDPVIVPEELDPIMIDIAGSELSVGDHIVSMFSDYNSRNSDVATRLAGIGAAGGIGYIAHPGRYSRTPQFYADQYAANPHIFGQAIYNQGDRYPGDRALWDAVLSITMPERPVWGISEDDTHRDSHVARNRTYMLMPYLSHTNVRESLTSGAFYATFSGQNDTPPELRGVEINELAGTITLSADYYNEVRWISMGQEVAQGLTIDLVNTPGVARYVRAEFQGAEGRMYTNPFGVTWFTHIVSTSPTNEATDVSLFMPLALTFNEAVKKGAGHIVVRDAGGNAVETIDVTSDAVEIVENTVSIFLSAPLTGSQAFYVEIDEGAILNLDDTPYPGIAGDDYWRFTTREPDNTPPEPNPMAFAVAPFAADSESISMIASTATDDTPPVQYLFENVTLGRDTGWIVDPEWTDTGLDMNMTYEYRVKARDAIGNETGWSPTYPAMIVGSWYTIPFVETFEPRALGALHGQGGWLAEHVVVQLETAFGGSDKAAAITHEDGYMRRLFTDQQTVVWTDFYVNPVFFQNDTGDVNPDATALFFFNEDGYLVVYDGTEPSVLSNTVAATEGEWIRVTVRSDYINKAWAIHLDGNEVASGLDFYNQDGESYTGMQISGAGQGVSTYVDDIQILLTSPLGPVSDVILTISSPHGFPSPAVGSHIHTVGAEITATMSGSPQTVGNSRYTVTGWTGTGSVPAAGTGTNVTFTIHENSTLQWIWDTEHRVRFNLQGE